MSAAADLLAELDRVIAQAAPAEIPHLIGKLEAAKAQAWARLVVPVPNGTGLDASDDSLDAEEAARRLGMSASWLYKNHKKLPFAGKQGRRTVFSARGLERWRAGRMRA